MKTKTVLQMIVIAAAAAGALAGQEAPASNDPGGWTKAKWGMTQAQIGEAFPDNAKLYPEESGSRMILGLNGVTMGEPAALTYRVRFFFDKSGGLREVLIVPELEPKSAKSRLLSGLTEKYGQPHAAPPEPTHGSLDYKWTWTFEKTIISLGYIDFGVTTLDYKLRQSSDAF